MTILGGGVDRSPDPSPTKSEAEDLFSSTRAFASTSITNATASTRPLTVDGGSTNIGLGMMRSETPTSSFSGDDRRTSTAAAAQSQPIVDDQRATHTIRLSPLRHNYGCVEEAASRQRCSVIAVVKADGYGHGAIETAVHLADYCGAAAFAVATLEEGIALRKALNAPVGAGDSATAAAGGGAAGGAGDQHHQPVHPPSSAAPALSPSRPEASRSNSSLSSVANGAPPPAAASAVPAMPPRIRSPRIRILVLGPPVGYPRSFDLFQHHNIELMVSGTEVARALAGWVCDADGRKRTEVERAAAEFAEEAIHTHVGIVKMGLKGVGKGALEDDDDEEEDKFMKEEEEDGKTNSHVDEKKDDDVQATNCPPPGDGSRPPRIKGAPAAVAKGKVAMAKAAGRTEDHRHAAATLSNVTGADLAKEVRAILLNQQAHKAQQQSAVPQEPKPAASAAAPPQPLSPSRPPSPPNEAAPLPRSGRQSPVTGVASRGPAGATFRGIEDAAKASRDREMAIKARRQAAEAEAKRQQREADDGGGDDVVVDSLVGPKSVPSSELPQPPTQRKRLRWHALVDSGMGRLGFKPDATPEDGDGDEASPADTRYRETIGIMKELHDMEVRENAPLEFYGMCTHMADASSKSDYTHAQMERFMSLLTGVRRAGLPVPTVSTDNSSALLTSNLDHFDPSLILSQPFADTRGFVRTGGAIYGQRPSFPQLRAVSTLTASVRHVAIIKEGESVGYDRAYTAPYDVRIATLTIGFADGYPRELGNGVGSVSIRRSTFKIAGNVCMDMMMVELGPAEDTAGRGSSVAVGDVAILWGPEGHDDQTDGLVKLQDIAATLNTTQSALTCGLNKVRVRREFV